MSHARCTPSPADMTITIKQIEHVLSLFPWPARLRRPRGIVVQAHGALAFEAVVSSAMLGIPARKTSPINGHGRGHTAERAIRDAVESYIEDGPANAAAPFALSSAELTSLRRALRMLTN